MNEPRSPIPFACPVDRGRLAPGPPGLTCETCGAAFPIVNGVPVLINDGRSVFKVSDFTRPAPYEGASGYGGSIDKAEGWRRAYRRFARRLSEAEVPGSRVDALERVLFEDPGLRVLVVGAGDRVYPGNVTYTDVAFGARVSCICDAHDLPFPDGSFDAVVADSVLEHVCDPQRCVAEFVRVLQPKGRVMAVTPFLQPVHMGAHDFTRFTYLGHRRLFRQFDDVESGMCGGPAYSALHLTRHLAATVTDRPRLRSLLRLAALLATYPMRHADRLLSHRESAYNTACAFYFFGTKRDVAISDREIIGMFRGR